MSIKYQNAAWNNKKVIIGETEITDSQPVNLLIGFHGADSTPENMLIHGNRLSLNNTIMVFPEGPVDAGEGLWSWWKDGPKQQETVTGFLNFTSQLIDEASRLSDRETRLCLCGFSQGAAAALVYAALGAHPVHKAASVCGFLPELPADAKRNSPSTVLGMFGTNDDVVPAFLAEYALDEMSAMGHSVTALEKAQGHEINVQNLAEMSEFFNPP